MSSDTKKNKMAVSTKVTSESSRKQPGEFAIVGIGASAGGLEAFKKFFNVMPSESGVAFIIIQHLDPNHTSITADLLARHTLMKVVQIEDQMPVEPDHIYVIPPNKDLAIHNCQLYLQTPVQPHGMRLPIDSFFRSLADDQNEKVVGVILSGTGSDGTLGIKAIKANGGMIMVQQPESAQFDGMPHSAIATGLADYIVPVEEMPERLLAYLEHSKELVETGLIKEQILEYIDTIIESLLKRTGYDFHNYKKGTLTRRIERRMSIKHIETIGDYARFIADNQDEAKLLFNDLLISVTNFYREPDSYKLLEKDVIQKIVQEKDDDEPIRVWVPGCATGEEAYSISMLFHEHVEAMKKHCPIQVFASDIDEQALTIARSGFYPVNIAVDVSVDLLRKYFKKKDSFYQVSKKLRDSVVFAVQNLISDPPFSKLDLISCRNLLIYIEPELQRKIITMFHFVLNENGYLFLGSSETVGQQENLFQPVHKKARLYKRAGPVRREKIDLPFTTNIENLSRGYGASLRFVEPTNLGKITQQLLLQQFAPFTVLINRKYEILYLYGQSGSYLEMTTGEPTQDLMSVVRDGLRSKLRGAIQRAVKNSQNIVSKARVKRDGSYTPVIITVLPVNAPKVAEGLLAITFEDVKNISDLLPEGAETDASNEALVKQLESELSETKEDLRSTIDEMEAANEELKTSNEEVLSMNEELQSSNEELETSKEELQSLNEELTTVNNQLQDKVEELASTNDDLSNLLSNTDIAALFLDNNLCIKRFTPAIGRLFNLIYTDIGRPIADISDKAINLTLVQDAKTVLKNLAPIEKEVYNERGDYFIQRIHSFRTEENRIEGVVVTFTDVTKLKRAQESLAKSKERIELLLSSTGESIYGVDKDGLCIFVNNKFCEEMGYVPAEVLGNFAHKLFHHTKHDGTHYPWEECFVYQSLSEGVSFKNGHDIAWRKDGTSFPTLYSVEPINESNGVTGAVVIFRDMTEEVEVANKMDHLARHDSLTGLVNRREFEERLHRIIDSVKQEKNEHILCYLDLDQFKVINDTCGHLAGDELLRQITGILSEHVRKRDTLARLGGDEFGVLMEHCDLHEGKRVANSMRDAVANYRFLWEGKTHTVGVSIGVVTITESVGGINDVLKLADAACYAAKESGRNRIHVYHEEDTNLALRHGEMQWVAKINTAVEEDRLFLTLQPIAPIGGEDNGKLSYEVLLRMHDKNGEVILPHDFLGAAERYNLSARIDRWVITNLFKWCSKNKPKMQYVSLININLSGQSLGDENFLKFVTRELNDNNIRKDMICFEITETAAITNLASANRFMHTLKEQGCVFALDDFGTGLSSFGYLKTLPVEYLKISGLFVEDIVDSTIDFAMVKSINEIAHVMGKKTIAESVESLDILNKLKELGVNYAQGVAIGKPVLLDDVKFNGKLS